MKSGFRKIFNICLITGLVLVTSSGCKQKDEALVPAPSEKTAVKVFSAEELVYLQAVAAEASSFDQTPDWAPEPDPMAPVDGDTLTRWSSGYEAGEQWISFDLGKNCVLSDVIIRWERAYAVDYQILVSKDGKEWTKVRQETDSKGGAAESEFTPVSCRYVKILSTRRINETWGISIWEVEMFGPAGDNPHADISKEKYLSKGDEAAEKKETEKTIDAHASKVVSLEENPFQKGVVYTSWMEEELSLPASDLTLAHLKEIGMDVIGIMVPAYQDDLNSTEIFTNDVSGGDTPTDESIEHAIKTCHKMGMRVMIKPHVDPRTDEARINIMPSEKWFDAYEKFTLRYAELSQKNGVELFCIGTELEATTFSAWTHRWDAIIDKVKSVYTGKLTYAANWTEYEEVPFWDKMDFIGIDAYFPLTSSDEASLEDLVNSWTAIAGNIEEWLKIRGLTDKGVILTEIGYPSATGANRQPWVAISNIENQEEQADCLEAVFTALNERPWFKGYYIWQYFPQDRWSPLGFTVKGKRAEEVIKKWLKRS
ncbi:MAG: discoidin domain-containing protein [Candidatus Omnitrophota bacterium]